MIFRQNKIYTFSFCSKVYAPALNAWVFLLGVKRWTSNHSYCWKGFTYTRDAGKPKNMWDLKDFSEEQAVELFRTNKGLINNYLKKKQPQKTTTTTTTTADHPGNNMGYFFLNSTIIFSCELCKRPLCEISYSGHY